MLTSRTATCGCVWRPRRIASLTSPAAATTARVLSVAMISFTDSRTSGLSSAMSTVVTPAPVGPPDPGAFWSFTWVLLAAVYRAMIIFCPRLVEDRLHHTHMVQMRYAEAIWLIH